MKQMEKEEQLFRKRICELAALSYERDIPVHTNFLTLNEQAVFQSISATLPPVKYELAGGSAMSERKVLCFLPSYEEEPGQLPFSCVEIRPSNPRFSESLTHRDFLGAIMNLGIERDMIGDILSNSQGAYVFVMNPMVSYLTEQLTTVRKTPVSLSVREDPAAFPQPEFERLEGTLSSVRLDAVTALCGRMSRGKAADLIEGEKASLNGQLCMSVSRQMKEGEVLSLRGIGKFRLESIGAPTKKGRIPVVILKYR